MGERWSHFLEEREPRRLLGVEGRKRKNLKSDVVCNVVTLFATSAILFIIYKMTFFLQIGDSGQCGLYMRIEDIYQFNKRSLKKFI